MKKKLIYVLVVPFLIFLTTCQSVRQTAQANHIYPSVTLPEIPFTLPVVDWSELAKLDVPDDEFFNTNRIFITDEFSPADYYEFSVPDPKLFALNNTIQIDLAKLSEEDYAFPLPGAKMLSGYAGKRRNHTGVDLKVARKDTVLAAFDGIVRMSRRNATYGNVIVLRHYNGLETLYSHNTQNLVKVGEKVKAGQPIATTGQTGRASTDHLHFETRINGQHFNPNLVFNFETQKLNERNLICVKQGNKVSIIQQELLPFEQETAYKEKERADGNS